MQQLSHARSTSAQPSSVSSISSLDSSAESAYANSSDGSKKLPTRSASLMPSYMKHVPINRKPVAPKAAAPEPSVTSPPPETKGILLVAIAASPHRSTLRCLQFMLEKTFYKRLVVLGSFEHEAEIKQLKVDIYALLGRLSQEVRVEMVLQNFWEESKVHDAVETAIEGGDTIQGVLCSPEYESWDSSGVDVMTMSQEQLHSPWKSSIGFLHTVAKSTLAGFHSDGHEHKHPGFFLVTSPTEQTPISTLSNSGCRTLMTLLVEANAGRNLTIDYAENVLLPEPPPIPKTTPNGGPKLPILDIHKDSTLDEYTPPESPTKLWALYNELGAAD